MNSVTDLKILVADDNRSDRMILKAIVRREGHQVIEAENGLEAVARYDQYQPDIILMDALMPEMNGLEATRLIKSRAGGELIPIIFLTSLQDAHSLAECLESGGDDFMSKPYSQVILKAKIKAFSRMRFMHAQLEAHNKQLVLEQQVAKAVFDNVAHSGCLDMPNIQYSLSPMAVFNGDTVLAERKPDGSLVLFLGDFTGHGLPAAIGAMPLAEIFYGMVAKGFSIEEVLREVNHRLFSILPTEVFCCAAMVELNHYGKSMRAWVGGVPDLYLHRQQTRQVQKIRSDSLPLGVLEPHAFNPRVSEWPMANGDRIFLWSDGIVEAENAEGEFFGESRLEALFQNTESDTLFDAILTEVERFSTGVGHSDDITLLAAAMLDIDTLDMPRLDANRGAIGGPLDWRMSLELGPQSLKAFNPLPMVLNTLVEVEGLRSHSGELYTLLSELYSNALEHGVLGLDSSQKASADGFAHYYSQREQRLSGLENGQVTFRLGHTPEAEGGRLTIELEDSGPGFDHERVTRSASSAAQHYGGRGLTLVEKLCDQLQYQGKGNRVTAVFRWPRPESH